MSQHPKILLYHVRLFRLIKRVGVQGDHPPGGVQGRSPWWGLGRSPKKNISTDHPDMVLLEVWEMCWLRGGELELWICNISKLFLKGYTNETTSVDQL